MVVDILNHLGEHGMVPFESRTVLPGRREPVVISGRGKAQENAPECQQPFGVAKCGQGIQCGFGLGGGLGLEGNPGYRSGMSLSALRSRPLARSARDFEQGGGKERFRQLRDG